MALTKFSFNEISQEEFDARRKEEAVAATTAALPAKPPRRFSVAVGVSGVVPKIKKKSDSLFSAHLDFTLPNVPNAQVTIPVFAMLRVPATILYSSLMLLFLQASNSFILGFLRLNFLSNGICPSSLHTFFALIALGGRAQF